MTIEAWYVIIGIVLLLVVLIFNKLMKLKNAVKNAASGIQVYLQQRFDLIPNLVEVVKGYVNHEKEVLQKIAELRNLSKTDMKAANELNGQFSQLYAVAESNPNLKASEQFLNLQKNLSKIENQLQASRRNYNMSVTELNNAVSIFPLNVFAAIFSVHKEELFQGNEEIKKSINIEL